MYAAEAFLEMAPGLGRQEPSITPDRRSRPRHRHRQAHQDRGIPLDSGAGLFAFNVPIPSTKPYLEVAQEVPGTVWRSVPGNTVHHIRHCLEDLVASSQDLTASGLHLEACGSIEGERPVVFTSHQGEDGIRRKLVDRTVFGDFDGFVQGLLDQNGRKADHGQ